LKLDPNYSGAVELNKKIERLKQLRQKGNDVFQDKKYTESVKIYTDALAEEDKKVPTAFTAIIYANRAAAYKQLGDFDNAIADLTSAIERNNTYVKAYIRRAQCYQEIELWEEAMKDYSSALSVEPFSTEYATMLQTAQQKFKELQSRSYYDVLGLPHFASMAEIKKSYRIMALKYHPDKINNSGISPLKAEKIFKEIQFCYEILSDPQKKAQYDRDLQFQKSMQMPRYPSAPQTNPYGHAQQNHSGYTGTQQYHQQQQQHNTYATTGW